MCPLASTNFSQIFFGPVDSVAININHPLPTLWGLKQLLIPTDLGMSRIHFRTSWAPRSTSLLWLRSGRRFLKPKLEQHTGKSHGKTRFIIFHRLGDHSIEHSMNIPHLVAPPRQQWFPARLEAPEVHPAMADGHRRRPRVLRPLRDRFRVRMHKLERWEKKCHHLHVSPERECGAITKHYQQSWWMARPDTISKTRRSNCVYERYWNPPQPPRIFQDETYESYENHTKLTISGAAAWPLWAIFFQSMPWQATRGLADLLPAAFSKCWFLVSNVGLGCMFQRNSLITYSISFYDIIERYWQLNMILSLSLYHHLVSSVRLSMILCIYLYNHTI